MMNRIWAEAQKWQLVDLPPLLGPNLLLGKDAQNQLLSEIGRLQKRI